MKAKLLAGKLLSIIEKGTISEVTGCDEKDGRSDLGKFALIKGEIGAKFVSKSSASSCLRPIDPSESIEKNGCYAVPIPKLKGLLETLKRDEFVEIEFVPNKTENSVGTLVFSSGKSLWKIPCQHPDVVAKVKFDDGDLCQVIEKDVFLEAVSSISFAINSKDATFTKSNICISIIGGKMLFAATDDIRCAVYKTDCSGNLSDKRFLVPCAYLSKILKLFDKGPIGVYSGAGFVRFSQEGHDIRMSLENESDVGNFPNFEDMFSNVLPINLRVMSSKLKAIITACYKMNQEESLMKIKDDNITFYSYDSRYGTSYKSSITSTGDKTSIVFGACSVYLLDFLKKVEEEIIQISFPLGIESSKPSYIMLSDEKHLSYTLTSLMDFVHLPPEGKE